MDIDLLKGDISDLNHVYTKYEKEFAEEERKDYKHLAMLLNDGRYKLLLARDKDKEIIVGYALVYDIENLNVLWLDYLAIFSEYRNKGYGTLMLKKIIKYKWEEKIGIFLEVEIPNSQDKQFRKNQIRRIGFYKRLGAKRLSTKYQLPTPNGGFPMYLYFCPFNNVHVLHGDMIKKTIISVFEYIHSDIPKKMEIVKSFLDKPVDEYF
jgi:GNAT superfamily N-acetyltransferase